MTRTRNLLWTFIAGAATGALAGLLFAPEKGQKTREFLVKRARNLRKDLEDAFEKGNIDLKNFGGFRKTA